MKTTDHRAMTALAGIALLLLTACGGAEAPTAGTDGSMSMCLEGATDCVDTPTNGDPGGGDSAADCEDGVECNDTGGDASSACMVGMPDCNDTPTEDCPECDPDAEPAHADGGDERMNPSITIVQQFVGEVRAVEQAPGTITSPMQMFLQEAMVDGRMVTVSFNGGEAPCFVVDHADVTEEADLVWITVWAGQADGATDCGNMAMSLQTVTVQLEAELGSRLLLDGSRSNPAENE